MCYVKSVYVYTVARVTPGPQAFDMQTLRERLGRAIRHRRTEAGYSQEGFADACRLHRTYIGSVERGETNISLDNMERITKALGIPLSRLILDAEQLR